MRLFPWRRWRPRDAVRLLHGGRSAAGKRGAPQAVSLDGLPVALGSHGVAKPSLGLRAEGSATKLVDKARSFGRWFCPAAAQNGKAENVVFWLSDDTRADKFKLWNKSPRVETPMLTRVFRAPPVLPSPTYSQGNESVVSHASLFTGLIRRSTSSFPTKRSCPTASSSSPR